MIRLPVSPEQRLNRFCIWHGVVFAAVFVMFLCVLCSRCCGEWVEVRPVRNSGYSGLLGELEDRMPPGRAAIYRDRDRVTWAHEMTHGLNSEIRNRHAGTGKCNAFYCFGGRAMLLPEPRGLTLSDVPGVRVHGQAATALGIGLTPGWASTRASQARTAG